MAFCLSWENFLSDVDCFLQICYKIDDGWSLEGNRNLPGGAYLKKTVTQMSTSCNVENNQCPGKNNTISQEIVKKILRWEYHVYFSTSYCVPVLCFNVWNANGSLLRLHEAWQHCSKFLKSQTLEDMYAILTQQDHPILLRPFFTIHPCKTNEFLFSSNDSEENSVIKFITSVGPMVNLSLDLVYGLPIKNNDVK